MTQLQRPASASVHWVGDVFPDNIEPGDSWNGKKVFADDISAARQGRAAAVLRGEPDPRDAS